MSTPYNPENSSNPDFGSTPDYGSTPSSSGAENTGSGAHSAPGNYGSSDSFGSYGASSTGAASNTGGFGAPNTGTGATETFGAAASGSTGAASTGQNTTSNGAANTNSGFGSYGAADSSNASAATGSFAQTSQQPNYGNQYGQQQYGQTQSSQAQGSQAQGAQFGQGQNQNFGAGAFPQDAQAAAGKKKDGFFGALFDFEFRRFVTIDFVKIIYIIYLVFAALMWVGGLLVAFGGFAKGAGIGLLMLIGWLIFGTLWALFQVVISRVMLEVLVSVVRIAQNTTELVDQGEKK